MPVTKLSREFYERFGDKLTDELVGCLNSIETSYRGELRDLLDAHFERYGEKLQIHSAGTAAQLARLEEKLEDTFERRLAETGAALLPVVPAVIGLYFKG